MRKAYINFVLLLTICMVSGCQSTYWNNRKYDCIDMISCSYGGGIGIKPRVGPIAISPLQFYRARAGIKGGEIFTSGSIDSSYIMPFTYLEAFKGGKNAKSRNKSFTAKGALLFTLPERYCGFSWLDISGELEFDNDQTNQIEKPKANSTSRINYSYYTDIEILLALGAGAKIGINPGEIIDFILGWTTLDIYGDDIKPKEKMKTEYYEDDSHCTISVESES